MPPNQARTLGWAMYPKSRDCVFCGNYPVEAATFGCVSLFVTIYATGTFIRASVKSLLLDAD